MGLGDNIMATGIAKGAAARGKRIAFGDGKKIIWDHNSEQIFRGNPNIASPGSEGAKDLEWIKFYRGSRIYNEHDKVNNRWLWNYEFKSMPGEIFLNAEELRWADQFSKGCIIVEKNVPEKLGVINKQWDKDRYEGIIKRFDKKVVELNGSAPSFRHALAALSRASLYIGPEGGLHHGAAAVGIPAVVIFGGWIPPQVTGYDGHINLTGGAKEFCGSLRLCNHCQSALKNISVDEVYNSAVSLI